MRKKGFSAEQIIGKLREAEVVLGQGSTVGEVSRKLSSTSHLSTFTKSATVPIDRLRPDRPQPGKKVVSEKSCEFEGMGGIIFRRSIKCLQVTEIKDIGH